MKLQSHLSLYLLLLTLALSLSCGGGGSSGGVGSDESAEGSDVGTNLVISWSDPDTSNRSSTAVVVQSESNSVTLSKSVATGTTTATFESIATGSDYSVSVYGLIEGDFIEVAGTKTNQEIKLGENSLSFELASAKKSKSTMVSLGGESYTLNPSGDASKNEMSVEVDGFESIADPGNPDVPQKALAVPLEEGVRSDSVQVSVSTPQTVTSTISNVVAPSPSFKAFIPDVDSTTGTIALEDYGSNKSIVDGKNTTVYNSDTNYPTAHVVSNALNLNGDSPSQTISYNPVLYNPVKGQLQNVTSVEVSVKYDYFEKYTAPANPSGKQKARFAPGDSTDPNKQDGYVIVTRESTKNQLGNSLTRFIDHKKSRNFNVVLVTDSDFNNMPGTDVADKIRNWLIAHRYSRNIRYVLLIGNPHPTAGHAIPMKMCYPRNNETRYPQYKDAPTDLFYAELDNNWDKDGDGNFGEYGSDSTTGIEFLGYDVIVGRMPYYDNINLNENKAYLERVIAYENSTDTAWRKNALMALAISDATTHGLGTKAQFNFHVYNSDTNSTMLAESSSVTGRDGVLNNANFVNELNKGYGSVFWWAHGSPEAAFLKTQPYIISRKIFGRNDVFPAMPRPGFFFQCSCLNGTPERTDNLGTYLYHQAIGTVSGTRVTWYMPQSVWTPRYLMNVGMGFYFNQYLLRNKLAAGEALLRAKAKCGTGSSYRLMNAFAFNLYGDPSVSIENTVTQDTEPPQLVITAPSVGTVVTSQATVEGTATDKTGIKSITVDGVQAIALEEGFARWRATVTNLTTGQHIFKIFATDTLGNVNKDPGNTQVTVVGQSAEIVFAGIKGNGLVDNYTTSQSVEIVNVRTKGTPSGYLVTESTTTPSLSDSGWTTSVPTSFTLSSGDGLKKVFIWVRSSSGLGNSKELSINLDATKPTLTSFTPVSRTEFQAKFSEPIQVTSGNNFAFTPTLNQVSLNSSAPDTVTLTLELTNVASQYTYSLSNWRDLAGNLLDQTTGTFDIFNTTPTAVSQQLSVTSPQTLDITLSGNDLDNDSLTYRLITQPQNGTFINTALPSLTYQPNTGFTGVDSFTFVSNDNIADSDIATIEISVSSADGSPVAFSGNQELHEDGSLDFTVRSSGFSSTSLTSIIVSSPVHGTISSNGLNFNYTPNANIHGADVFSFQITDGTTTSNTAKVFFTILPVNDLPVVNAGPDMNVPAGGTVNLNASVFDIDLDALTYEWSQTGGNGTLSIQNANTKNASFVAPNKGVFDLTFTAMDRSSFGVTDSLKVTIVNTTPFAIMTNSQIFAMPGSNVILDGSPSFDPNGDPLTYTWTQNGGNAITLTSPSSATPSFQAPLAGGFNFQLQVNDGILTSTPATVNVSIINSTPIANAGVDQTVSGGDVVTLDGSLSSDANGTTLTYQWSQNSGTSVTLSSTTADKPTFTAPAAGGIFEFALSVNDGQLISDADLVRITASSNINQTPSANAQSLTLAEDDSLAITLTGSDPEGATLSYAISTNPGFGAITGTAPNITYIPNGNFNGGDSFSFTVNDGTNTSAAATVSLNVTAVNDAPVANAGTDMVVAASSNVVLIGSGNDIDGDSLTYTWAQSVGDSVTLSQSTSSTAFFIAPTTPGTLTFQLSVSDNSLTTQDSVNVIVTTAVTAGSLLTENIGGVDWNWRFIPAGNFSMGATTGETGADNDEYPEHSVTISSNFWLLETEVSQAQWSAIMGTTPSHFAGNSLAPVESVSWTDVSDLATVLNSSAGTANVYRLPTEAEWEYAYRAGASTKSRFHWGDDSTLSQIDNYAWTATNSGNATKNSKDLLPNAWNLYGMSGSVFEWVSDYYSSTYYSASATTDPTGPTTGTEKVLRGGSWKSTAAQVRGAARELSGPAGKTFEWGVRLARIDTSTSNSLTDLGAGLLHGIGLLKTGEVFTIGVNTSGQLGNGTTTTSTTPILLSSPTSVKQISAGDSFSLALKQDGTVYSWGQNNSGQLGNGTTTDSTTPVQVTGLTGITLIRGGANFVLALDGGGNVHAWGLNSAGQLGDGSTTDRSSSALVTGLTGAVKIDAGSKFSMALVGGNLYTWGENSNGQLGDGTTTNNGTATALTSFGNITDIAAGDFHSLAVADGNVFAWGLNTDGQVGNGTTTDQSTPVMITGLPTIVSVTAGSHHSLALDDKGSVWAWGRNTNGQVGDGTTTNVSTPVRLSLSNVTFLRAGTNFTIAKKSDGTFYLWGNNGLNLITNAGTNITSPLQITVNVSQ